MPYNSLNPSLQKQQTVSTNAGLLYYDPCLIIIKYLHWKTYLKPNFQFSSSNLVFPRSETPWLEFFAKVVFSFTWEARNTACSYQQAMLVIYGEPAFHMRQSTVTTCSLLRENLQASLEVAEQTPELSSFHGISSHSCSVCTIAQVPAKSSCLDSRLTVLQLALKEYRDSVYTLRKGISWFLVSLK